VKQTLSSYISGLLRAPTEQASVYHTDDDDGGGGDGSSMTCGCPASSTRHERRQRSTAAGGRGRVSATGPRSRQQSERNRAER